MAKSVSLTSLGNVSHEEYILNKKNSIWSAKRTHLSVTHTFKASCFDILTSLLFLRFLSRFGTL